MRQFYVGTHTAIPSSSCWSMTCFWTLVANTALKMNVQVQKPKPANRNFWNRRDLSFLISIFTFWAHLFKVTSKIRNPSFNNLSITRLAMHDSNSGHRPHKLRYTSAINQKTQKKNNDDVIYSLTKKNWYSRHNLVPSQLSWLFSIYYKIFTSRVSFEHFALN